MSTPPTVLVVDDETALADLHELWLQGEYTVRKAYGGEEALEKLDDAVDVVLLDRRMPDLSGDEVLERIRQRDWSGQVALVTAVDPDFGILEMGFDDYLVKPVSREELEATVERLLRRERYSDSVRELFALSAKVAALESEKPTNELDANEEYDRLQKRIGKLRTALDDTGETLDDDDYRSLFYRLNENGQSN